MRSSSPLRGLALILASSLAQMLAGSVASAAPMGAVHTALVEFDACLPLADGRVLAGSAGGLVLVDAAGKLAATYTALDGLPGTRVHSLVQSDAGVWVGTEGGAALISLAGDASLQIKTSLSSEPVRDILAAKDALYLATWGQGLLALKGDSLAPVHETRSAAERRVTSVARQGKDLYWSTAGAGLWHRDARGAVTRSGAVEPGAMLWGLEREGESIWIAGEEGVVDLDGRVERPGLHAVRATALVDGKRLAASFGSGLQSLERGTLKRPADRYARSLSSAHGLSCMGTQKNLWLRRAGRWKAVALAEELPSNDIAAFASDGTRTYVGTFESGVAELIEGRFRPIDLDIDPQVNALAIDARTGALWIGTSTALVRYHEGRLARFGKASGLPSKHILSLFALPEGGVLVGTASGGATVKKGLVSALVGKGGLVTGNVWAVTQSADGSYWLGSTRGLFRIRGARVTRFGVASGELKDDWVMALAPAEDGIFVGTYKAGVVHLATAGETPVATQLGEGWINPGGLHWDGTRLRAATMHGPLLGNGKDASWRKGPAGPGLDTTAFVPRAGGSWVLTRRGLLAAAAP